jgi:hypothetical protein
VTDEVVTDALQKIGSESAQSNQLTICTAVRQLHIASGLSQAD